MVIDHDAKVEGNTLVVTAGGREASLDEARRYVAAVLDAAGQAGCTHILCDERKLEHSLGTFDIYRKAEFTAHSAPRTTRAATVCSPGESADAAFWETVAVNRGLQVRVFTDPAEARAWLEG